MAAAGADIAISFVASADKAQAVVRSLEDKGVRATAFKADQGDPSQSEVLIRSVFERFGQFDILVNNAAVSYYGTIDSPETDNAAMDRQWAINVTGVVANIRAAVKVMRPGGRIISIGSGIATRAGIPGVADYAGTKSRYCRIFKRGRSRPRTKRHHGERHPSRTNGY